MTIARIHADQLNILASALIEPTREAMLRTHADIAGTGTRLERSGDDRFATAPTLYMFADCSDWARTQEGLRCRDGWRNRATGVVVGGEKPNGEIFAPLPVQAVDVIAKNDRGEPYATRRMPFIDDVPEIADAVASHAFHELLDNAGEHTGDRIDELSQQLAAAADRVGRTPEVLRQAGRLKTMKFAWTSFQTRTGATGAKNETGRKLYGLAAKKALGQNGGKDAKDERGYREDGVGEDLPETLPEGHPLLELARSPGGYRADRSVPSPMDKTTAGNTPNLPKPESKTKPAPKPSSRPSAASANAISDKITAMEGQVARQGTGATLGPGATIAQSMAGEKFAKGINADTLATALDMNDVIGTGMSGHRATFHVGNEAALRAIVQVAHTGKYKGKTVSGPGQFANVAKDIADTVKPKAANPAAKAAPAAKAPADVSSHISRLKSGDSSALADVGKLTAPYVKQVAQGLGLTKLPRTKKGQMDAIKAHVGSKTMPSVARVTSPAKLKTVGKDRVGNDIYENPLNQGKGDYKYPGVSVMNRVQNDSGHPIQMLDPKSIISAQKTVASDKLGRITGDIKNPVIVVRHNGNNYLEEGNHRAVQAFMSGQKVPAKVINPDGTPVV